MESNGKEEVVEIDSRHTKKPTTIHTGLYKPVVDGKPLKRLTKLTSTFWKLYDFLEPDEDGNLFYKCKKCEHVYTGESKHGTRNLKAI